MRRLEHMLRHRPMENGVAEEARDITVADIAGLLGEQATDVQVRETRTSWVFLTPRFVFKQKKPIHDDFVDFRSPEARLHNAEDEVRLNRRLAPDAYLGVAPIVRTCDGIALAGEGEAIDWLVHMKRLPGEMFLDSLAAAGEVPRERVERLAGRLAAFYASAPRVAIAPDAYRSQMRREILAARATLANARFGLSQSKLRRILGAQLRFIASRADPVGSPARAGRIVEGHGDLRPEHAWLGPDPVVIDCLEFSYDLRRVDPFDEISYMGLECERLGVGFIGPILLDALADRLGYRPPAALLAFYRSLRAVMRARFSLRHLLEPHPREPAKWPPLGRAYLSLADRAAADLPIAERRCG